MFNIDFSNIQKKKEPEKLENITLKEVSFVNKPANQIPFLIIKSERGEDLNIIEKVFTQFANNDIFSKSELSEIDDSLRVIGDLDDDTLNAIGALLTIAGTNQAVAKQKILWPSFSVQQEQDDDDEEIEKSEGHWPSFTNQCPRPSQVEL